MDNMEIMIAIITTIISLVSIIIAIRSNSIARKSLDLSNKVYQETQSNFDLYYNEGFRITVDSERHTKRLLLFCITTQNKSKSTNSFKANLEIEYQRNDDSTSKIIIEHSPELSNFLTNKEKIIYPKDIVLDASNSTTMWLIFEQPPLIDNSIHRIEKYCVKLTDLMGYMKIVETVILKDIN